MAERFPYPPSLTSPITRGAAVTPDNDNDLATPSRALWVGTGGNISLILADDSAAITLTNIPDGTLLPVRAKRIRSTSTTASGIVALD